MEWLARALRLNSRKRFVVVESPYAGAVEANIAYAQWAMCDAIGRGETPYASHLLLTQVLYDHAPSQRELGLQCCNDIPGPRVYYVDTVTRVQNPLWDERRNRLGWAATWRLCVAMVYLGGAVVFGHWLGIASQSAITHGVNGVTSIIAAATALMLVVSLSFAAEFGRSAVHLLRLSASGYILTSGMFRAFLRNPGELRQLKPSVLEAARNGVGPVADRMTWGALGPSEAYLRNKGLFGDE